MYSIGTSATFILPDRNAAGWWHRSWRECPDTGHAKRATEVCFETSVSWSLPVRVHRYPFHFALAPVRAADRILPHLLARLSHYAQSLPSGGKRHRSLRADFGGTAEGIRLATRAGHLALSLPGGGKRHRCLRADIGGTAEADAAPREFGVARPDARED